MLDIGNIYHIVQLSHIFGKLPENFVLEKLNLSFRRDVPYHIEFAKFIFCWHPPKVKHTIVYGAKVGVKEDEIFKKDEERSGFIDKMIGKMMSQITLKEFDLKN